MSAMSQSKRPSGTLLAVAAVCVSLAWGAATLAEDEEPSDGSPSTWISEDIDKAYAQAKETGKPLLVAFR